MAVTLSAALAAPCLPTGIATADDKAVLGGGAGIVVAQNYCTLATIGHDKTGELVGFTAGHCGGLGAQVVAEGSNIPVGTVTAVGDGLDYAVIKLDPTKVTPTANFAGFAVNGIGPDPDFREPACTDGAATGVQCGVITTIPGPGPIRNMSRCPFQPGDEGRPVTAENRLIGVGRNGWTAIDAGPLHYGQMPESFLILFSAILNDVNSKGVPGAGFTPI